MKRYQFLIFDKSNKLESRNCCETPEIQRRWKDLISIYITNGNENAGVAAQDAQQAIVPGALHFDGFKSSGGYCLASS